MFSRVTIDTEVFLKGDELEQLDPNQQASPIFWMTWLERLITKSFIAFWTHLKLIISAQLHKIQIGLLDSKLSNSPQAVKLSQPWSHRESVTYPLEHLALCKCSIFLKLNYNPTAIQSPRIHPIKRPRSSLILQSKINL